MKPGEFTFEVLDSVNVFQLIEKTREGIDFEMFDRITGQIPLGLSVWSKILNISERTIQRYRRDKKRFDPIHSERLLMVIMLFNKGKEVFGGLNDFMAWLNSKSVPLGGIKPVSLLDNIFGINMVRDELVKIEHGILA